MKKYLHIYTSILAIAILAACGKENNPEPNPNPTAKDFELVLVSPVEVTPGETVTVEFKNGKGPVISDVVYLNLPGVLPEEGREYSLSIKSVKESSFTYAIPRDFVADKYNFCIRRGKVQVPLGTVQYKIKGGGDIEPEPGMTVYGKVICNGKGLANVVVSDGYEVVRTNQDGVYQMPSAKQNPYVFVTLPSGYTVINNGVLPVNWQSLRQAASTAERVDFTLFEDGDQTNHTMLLMGDMHMANRTKDREQFRIFTSEVSKYVSEHPGDKIYALTLGDMTWDLYWYQNNYCFAQFLTDINAIKNLQIFPTIGNHDHDMNALGDWDTVVQYKKDMGPNYYSFNIGQVHYVVIDNIQCTNARASKTDGSVRQYNDYVVTEDIEWLKKDLAFVSKDTPIVVTMHAPVWSQTGTGSLNNASAFAAIFNGYTDVTFVSGHSHKLWTVFKNNIKEHNSGAVCAAWWWAGKYDSALNLAQDGAPSGYRIMDVKGKTLTSLFKGTGRDVNFQFRSYDRNKIEITPASCGITASPNAENFTAHLAENGGYNNPSGENEVLINVFDYNDKWKVEVTENGKALDVKRVTAYDPLWFLCYPAPRFKESATISWTPHKTNHMFSVKASNATNTLEIKVTDDEGRVYTESMKRPKAFNTSQYK